MPTLITHAIAASALSTIAPDAVPRVRLGVVLAVLAMLPDLDVIGLRQVALARTCLHGTVARTRQGVWAGA